MLEFLEMGGYARFVWPAYGIFFVVLIVNWWSARRRRLKALRTAKMRLARSKR